PTIAAHIKLSSADSPRALSPFAWKRRQGGGLPLTAASRLLLKPAPQRFCKGWFENAAHMSRVFNHFDWPIGTCRLQRRNVKTANGILLADEDGDGPADSFQFCFRHGQSAEAARAAGRGPGGFSFGPAVRELR